MKPALVDGLSNVSKGRLIANKSRSKHVQNTHYPHHEHRALIYLTPTGRGSPTQDLLSSVPGYHQSYGDVATLFRQYQSHATLSAAYFIDQFCTHVEKTMSGNSELNNLCWEIFQQNEDAYSRKIVGHHVHESLHTESVIKALQKAVSGRKTTQLLIHHSDRGAQYCSDLYQRLHAKYGIKCSMTDGYDCYQNAMAERINGILKTEFLLSRSRNLADAVRMVDESVRIYNGERPHLALKYKTPDAMHQAF